MDFSWGGFLGIVAAAAVFVFIKAFFDREDGGKFFSYQMVVDILILTVLFQASTWLVAQF